jgi:uncharacterized membrane protein required for colicin V production
MELPENLIPVINIALIVIVIFVLINGYRKGFLWECVRILGIIASIFIAWILSPGIAAMINLYPRKWVPFSGTEMGTLIYAKLNSILWFIVILVICLILLIIIRPLFKAITEIPVMKQVNGTLGALFALLPMFFYMLIVIYLLNTPLVTNGKDIINGSYLRYVQMSGEKLIAGISSSFGENVAVQKMLSDPLSLTNEDLDSIISWLQRSQLSSEQIRDFLTGYGIDVNQVNELLGNGN